jgi:hypothetical protein
LSSVTSVPFTAGHERVADGEATSDVTVALMSNAVESKLDLVRVLVRDHVETDDHERVLVRVLDDSVEDPREEEVARADEDVIREELLLEDACPVEEVEEVRVRLLDGDELVEVSSSTLPDDDEAGRDDAGEDDCVEDLTADEDAEDDAANEEDLVVGMIGTETGPAILMAAFVLPS